MASFGNFEIGDVISVLLLNTHSKRRDIHKETDFAIVRFIGKTPLNKKTYGIELFTHCIGKHNITPLESKKRGTLQVYGGSINNRKPKFDCVKNQGYGTFIWWKHHFQCSSALWSIKQSYKCLQMNVNVYNRSYNYWFVNACKYGELEVVKHLFKCSKNRQYWNLQSAFSQSIRYNHIQIIDFLLDFAIKNGDGVYPLYFHVDSLTTAYQNRNCKILDLLLSKAQWPAVVDNAPYSFYQKLNNVFRDDQINILKIILKYHPELADSNDHPIKPQSSNTNLLQYAIAHCGNGTKIIEYLIDNWAHKCIINELKPYPNHNNQHVSDPTICFVMRLLSKYESRKEMRRTYFKILKLLLECHDCDINWNAKHKLDDIKQYANQRAHAQFLQMNVVCGDHWNVYSSVLSLFVVQCYTFWDTSWNYNDTCDKTYDHDDESEEKEKQLIKDMVYVFVQCPFDFSNNIRHIWSDKKPGFVYCMNSLENNEREHNLRVSKMRKYLIDLFGECVVDYNKNVMDVVKEMVDTQRYGIQLIVIFKEYIMRYLCHQKKNIETLEFFNPSVGF